MAVESLHARVLNLVGEVGALLEVEQLRDALLVALRAEIPCDYASLNQVGPDPHHNWSIVDPPMPPEAHELFYRLAAQNPLAERHMRTRDGRPYRLSDLVTQAQFHQTDLYREFYAPIGVEYQISFALPSAGGLILAVALSRCRSDFTDDERELLALVRPHLTQIYRNAIAYSAVLSHTGQPPDQASLQALGLTPAQANVLRLMATGHSVNDISSELGISQRTVQKHLQQVYKAMGVSNAAAAIHRAWQATVSPAST